MAGTLGPAFLDVKITGDKIAGMSFYFSEDSLTASNKSASAIVQIMAAL